MASSRWKAPLKLDDRVRIENPLGALSDEEVRIDAIRFVNSRAPFLSDKVEDVCRAAHVAKHIRFYEQIARGYNTNDRRPPITLTEEEKDALVREKDKIISEKGMRFVFATVSLAAFLQGFVQSSFTGANVYEGYWREVSRPGDNPHVIGITNGIAYLAAALIGCPLSDPVNQIAGRRGAILIASLLIAGTSIGAATLKDDIDGGFDPIGTGNSTAWKSLVALRLVNGIGMGIKAVSTPILASETAIGYWRGTALLMWQLWVALGIFVSSFFNLLISLYADSAIKSLKLILGSPLVPAIMLAISLYFTPESPRFYLRPQRGNYNPKMAYRELRRLRNTELQALRDLYLVHRSVSFTDCDSAADPNPESMSRAPTMTVSGKPKLSVRLHQYLSRYRDLFTNSRLRNSTISSCIVAFGQQLCGINIFAFYSTTFFIKIWGGVNFDGKEHENKEPWKIAMIFSLAFGLTNFIFGIPALGTIDTFGRRKWLLVTIPGMALALVAAAIGLQHEHKIHRIALTATFMLIHTMFYSPAMGPVPFTLASEAFPLSHRENGCSVAVSVNLFFAGLLAWFFPMIDKGMAGNNETGEERGGGGSLGLFAAFNAIAFVLVYFFVEETKQRSLEDLDQIYNISKRRFARFQATKHLPWFLKRWLLCSREEEKPDFFDDTTTHITPPEEEMVGMSPPGSPPVALTGEDERLGAVLDRPGSRSRYE